MNKIVICLVLISCASLCSMDSKIMVQFMDDDGNVQAEKQIREHLLKDSSGTLKGMLEDISTSSISIPMSQVSVKTWDEIESLWTLWDSKHDRKRAAIAVSNQLATKSLDELVCILNSLEYLHEPNKVSFSSVAIFTLEHQIKDDLRKGHEPVLQQLKPRLTRLVIDSMLSEFKKCVIEDGYEIERFPPSSYLPLKVFEFTAPEYVTISQATVLWKIMKGIKLQSFMLDGKNVDEKKIYKSLDDSTKCKMENNFLVHDWCCAIL